MKKMVNRIIASLIILILIPVSANAQKTDKDSILNRTVVVEQEYNPDITDASKMNVLPKIEEPVVSKKRIDYSGTIHPLTSFGTFQPMQSFSVAEIRKSIKKGYARLGFGNKGNADVKLGYLFDFGAKDKLSFSASLAGSNGKVELKPSYGIDIETVDWKSRFYGSDANLEYTHLFDKISMNIAGKFGMDNFNYRQIPKLNQSDLWEYTSDFMDKQHYAKGRFDVNFASIDETLPVQFTAGTEYLLFDRKYEWGEKVKDREQIIRTKGSAVGQIVEGQNIGLNLEMNNLFYTANKDYTLLDLNPHYIYRGENWRLRLGAHVDFAMGKGKIFEAAPDVKIEYVFDDSYSLYLNAEGGRVLNDYRQLEIVSPYWNFFYPMNWKNTYIPLDASLGLKGAVSPGFWFRVFGGYQIRKDDLCFNYIPSHTAYYGYDYFMPANTRDLYVGAQLKYKYKDRVDISVKGQYNSWDASQEYVLLLKPVFELGIAADIRILNSLSLNIGYNYITRPNVTLDRIDNLPEGFPGYEGTYKKRMAAINDLSIGMTYNIYKGLSAYLKINNLLNQNYQFYYNYPMQKFNFLAGLSFGF